MSIFFGGVWSSICKKEKGRKFVRRGAGIVESIGKDESQRKGLKEKYCKPFWRSVRDCSP